MKSEILITGGHAGTTALATIEEILKRKAFKKIAWIGNKKAIESGSLKTIESRLFTDLEIDYYEIDSGRLQRKWSKQTLSALFKIPLSFIKAFKFVNEKKPQIVLSFGGAISVPVCFSAWLLGIPIIVHEQTIEVGLANKISSIFAEKIALARIESKKHFDIQKTIHVGNPINSYLRKLKRKETKLPTRPIIYITGGSRGSQRINKVVFESIDELSKDYNIIHHTGDLDYKKSKKIKSKNYKSYNFVHPRDLKSILETANIVVSRSGANTVAELIAFSIPSILIPIPWTRYDEQNKNARLANSANISEILTEDNLSKESLIKLINSIAKNYKKYKSKKLETTSKDLDAHENLVELLLETLE